MSDLNVLIKQRKIDQVKKFWGEYEYLNNPAGDVSDSLLFKLQKSRLSILKNQSSKLIAANEFLENVKNISYENEISKKIVERGEQKIYQRIVELINSGLFSSNLNPTGSAMRNKTYEQDKESGKIQQDALKIIDELTSLLKLIDYANTNQLTDNLMKAFNGKKISGYSSYAEYKAIEVEKLMTHLLIQSSPSWKAFQTGQFYNKGQQLLQDAFVFDSNVLTTQFDTDLSFTVKANNKKNSVSVKSLEQFFKYYENLSGNFSIMLSDELYDKFLELSIMTAQAKSGHQLQKLLNESPQRNSISLNELGPTSSLIGLMKLYNLNWIDPQKSSNSLTAITNYCLSKSIILTNITGNSIYFTKDGFISATDWMDAYQQMLKFNPDIKKISANLLDAKNPYAFSKVT